MSTNNITTLSPHQQNILNMLTNGLKKTHAEKIANLTNFITNYNFILNFIDKNSEWSDNTRESVFFAVAKFYKILDEIVIAAKFSEQGYNYKKAIEANKKENKMTTNELFNYIPHENYIKIFNSMVSDGTTPDHYKKLMLGLMVLQPPLRSNFYQTCQILLDRDKNNGINNYILINGDEVSFIVNNDKVSKHVNKKNEIPLESVELKELIKNSVNTYPRKYLFETEKREMLTEDKLLKLLRSSSNNPGFTFSQARSNYVTWFYNNNKSLSKREELAKSMRHTVATSHLNYYKDITEKLPTEEERKNHNETKERVLNYNKKRRDLLYRVSKVPTLSPTPKSIEKYNLKQVDGIWV